MDAQFNQNLTKLSQLLRKTSSSTKSKAKPNQAMLHLMLARSVSISTQSSSRLLVNQNSKLQPQQPIKNEKQNLESRRPSLARQMKKCDSYKSIYKLQRKYSTNDGSFGMRGIFSVGQSYL